MTFEQQQNRLMSISQNGSPLSSSAGLYHNKQLEHFWDKDTRLVLKQHLIHGRWQKEHGTKHIKKSLLLLWISITRLWLKKIIKGALAAVAQWSEWQPVNPQDRWFGSWSGYLPTLQTRSPVGGMWEATTQWCFSPSLCPSLPLSLKINK